MFRTWVTAGILSLQASLSLADSLPEAVTPDHFPVPGATAVLLGRDLFFDPVLSGNRNISCATCHHPDMGSGDAVSLGIGEGGQGLGSDRRPGLSNLPPARVPRHAPALFNLGARGFTTLFHDGRVQADDDARFNIRMPEGAMLERPLPSVLAAQALMPLVSADEMAGHPGENPVADAAAAGRIRGLDGAWQILAGRVAAIPEYRRRFAWLLGPAEPVHITDIAGVIADFITFEFRSTDSRFDAFLNGNDAALSNRQLHGMNLFYNKAGCAACHSGPFQTDHDFHAIGLPPLGPGKGHGRAGYADHGRGAVTADPRDRYRFRTPSLRNVTLTAPYGHNGAYARLEDMVRHHLDPLTMLAEYTPEKARLPDFAMPASDTEALADFDEMLRIGMSVDITPVALNDREVDAILAFLEALTDPSAREGRLGAPAEVPSGLPLDPGQMVAIRGE
ncbi:cytochrome-c peroxidase [Roseovarius sp. TE539]|uniref:cytochrome c peroxidase n=1 Tax=Roseovarius sp. TE539 TaxID=2249812 RepID=UPI000DE05822|nr:cytochrome c peroxidase [Roseovarius sp. TE539]RBI77245.1 cytochrome-c peroxidase [Roseovarius sp. TE539]